MPIRNDHKAVFLPGQYYHVLCKSLPEELLFRSDENKRYFLQQFDKYIFPFTKVFCYCLLDNHAHFLLQVRDIQEIITVISNSPKETITITQLHFLEADQKEFLIDPLLEKQFNSFFVSYARSYNNMFSRKGHLFIRPFRRVAVDSSSYLTQLIVYIHANVLKHGIQKDFTKYKWSSYNAILSESPTKLERQFLIDWFGSKEIFIKNHAELAAYYYDHNLGLE